MRKLKIYRKSTTTDTVIHHTSNHPTQHKHATFISMLHRLRNIPMDKEDYTSELNTIKYIAQQNGYKHILIDTLLKNITHKQNKTPKLHNTNTLHYHTKIKTHRKLLQHFVNLNTKLLLKPPTQFKNIYNITLNITQETPTIWNIQTYM